MAATSGLKSTQGYLILVVAILSYSILYFLGNPLIIAGLINTASATTSFQELCQLISYYGDCSVSLIYTWLLSRIPVISIPALNLIVMLLLYVSALKISRSHIVAGFASLIYAMTPAVILQLWIDKNAMVSSSILLTISALLLHLGFTNGLKMKYMLPGLALAILGIFHPLLPVIVALTGVLTLTKYLQGFYDKRMIVAPGVVLVAILIGVLLNGFDFYSIITIPSIILSVGALLLVSFIRGAMVKSPYRAVAVLIVVVASASSLLITLTSNWFKEPVTSLDNPFLYYGLSVLLVLPGVVIGFLESERERSMPTLALVLSLFLISTLDPSVFPVALVFYILVCSFAINGILSIVQSTYSSVRGIPRRVLSIVPLVLLLVAVFLPPLIITSSRQLEVNIMYEIASLARDRGLKTRLNIPELMSDLARAIVNKSESRDILVIVDWDYSDVIQGSIASHGVKARVLASSMRDKEMLSRIFTSDWKTALYTIKNISGSTGIREVYVVVSYAYTSKANSSYMGVPAEKTLPGETFPRLGFEAYGDLYRFKTFLEYSNRSTMEYISDYPQLTQLLGSRFVALTWRDRALDTLLVQLSLKALQSMGYSNIYNYNAEISPATSLTPTIEGFEVVYLRNIEMGTVELTYYGNFTVNYLIAAFKLVNTGG